MSRIRFESRGYASERNAAQALERSAALIGEARCLVAVQDGRCYPVVVSPDLSIARALAERNIVVVS